MYSSPSATQIQAATNILNKSCSKMLFSFSKSPRFPSLKRSSNSYAFYDLPSTRATRATSLGYGSKTDFTLSRESPGFPNIKRDFDKGTQLGPSFSFGLSRNQVYCSTNIPRGRDAPGPGAYLPKTLSNSPSFSLRAKVTIPLPNRDTPGPAAYTPHIGLNKDGNYPLSKMINVHGSCFGNGSGNRFKYVYNDSPGPSAYNVRSNIGGYLYNSKYENARDITFGSRFPYGKKRDVTPGPGAYNAFSEFGIVDPYFKKKKYVRKKNVTAGSFRKKNLGKKKIENITLNGDETNTSERHIGKKENNNNQNENNKNIENNNENNNKNDDNNQNENNKNIENNNKNNNNIEYKKQDENNNNVENKNNEKQNNEIVEQINEEKKEK